MRTVFAVAVLLGAGAITAAQPPKEPEPRYGIKPRLKQYPQTSPKESLKSTLSAMEKADHPYLVAQLLDPKFVDDAVTDRVKLFEVAAETDLIRLRDFQRANPGRIADEDRLPLDPKAFRALSQAKAREMAFKQLTKDIVQKLTDDPQVVKELSRIFRDGTFAGDAATHADIKNRTLYFKSIDGRWFLENRQADEKKEP